MRKVLKMFYWSLRFTVDLEPLFVTLCDFPQKATYTQVILTVEAMLMITFEQSYQKIPHATMN